MCVSENVWHHVMEITEVFHDLDVKAAGLVTDYVGMEYERGDSTADFVLRINPLDVPTEEVAE